MYLKVKPFKKSLFLLHWLEITSLLGLCYQVVFNLFKAYVYLYEVPSNMHEEYLTQFFRYTEPWITPVTLFVLYLFANKALPLIKKIRITRTRKYDLN